MRQRGEGAEIQAHHQRQLTVREHNESVYLRVRREVRLAILADRADPACSASGSALSSRPRVADVSARTDRPGHDAGLERVVRESVRRLAWLVEHARGFASRRRGEESE